MSAKQAEEFLSSNHATKKNQDFYAEVKEKILVFQWE